MTRSTRSRMFFGHVFLNTAPRFSGVGASGSSFFLRDFGVFEGSSLEGPGGVCPTMCDAAGIGMVASPGNMILATAVDLAGDKGGSGAEDLDETSREAPGAEGCVESLRALLFGGGLRPRGTGLVPV